MIFYLVRKLDYDQESHHLHLTVQITFWMQFFNTAILLVIVNANMTESYTTFGLVGGSLQDFNRTWFKLIGNTIVGTMVINSIIPFVTALFNDCLKGMERVMDRGSCLKSSYVTSKTSISDYIALYAGFEHPIHEGFASLLIIIFVTFTFGFGIPVLFPIAFFSIVVLYRFEKYSLYYRYRRPPMYDKEVTQYVTKTLRLAPVFYLISAYWMLSN